MKFCVVVQYSDKSACVGVYGPYNAKEDAEEEIKNLQKLPGMQFGAFLWEIFPLINIMFLDTDN